MGELLEDLLKGEEDVLKYVQSVYIKISENSPPLKFSVESARELRNKLRKRGL